MGSGSAMSPGARDSAHATRTREFTSVAGVEAGMVIAFADVTAEREMIRDLARFRYLFQNANDIITVVDETGHVRYASPSNERVLGYPDGWRHPVDILGIVHPEDLDTAAKELTALLAGDRGPEPFLVRVQAFDGTWRTVDRIGVNLLDEPAVGGIVITARHATERARLTEELAHRATHDELTDLPSRRLLEARLADALVSGIRDDTRVGLCFVDLDGWGWGSCRKKSNHRAGSNWLQKIRRTASVTSPRIDSGAPAVGSPRRWARRRVARPLYRPATSSRIAVCNVGPDLRCASRR